MPVVTLTFRSPAQATERSSILPVSVERASAPAESASSRTSPVLVSMLIGPEDEARQSTSPVSRVKRMLSKAKSPGRKTSPVSSSMERAA